MADATKVIGTIISKKKPKISKNRQMLAVAKSLAFAVMEHTDGTEDKKDTKLFKMAARLVRHVDVSVEELEAGDALDKYWKAADRFDDDEEEDNDEAVVEATAGSDEK